jgi:streptogramin lyase
VITRTLAVLFALMVLLVPPAAAAPSATTVASATTVDFRVVLTAHRTSTGSSPTAAVTATVYRLDRASWKRTATNRLPGTFFWFVVSGRRAVCELSISTGGTAKPHATIRLLLSPSLGCAKPYVLPLA